MNKTLASALAVGALISGISTMSQPASAMGFKNCTGKIIRIQIFKNNDVIKIKPLKSGNKLIGVNGYRWFPVSKSLKQVRVFKGRILDKRMLQKSGLEGGHKFSIRRRGNGGYYISTENDCARSATGPRPGPAPGPQYRVTIPVDPGYWIAGANRGRYKTLIRRVSATSFTIERARSYEQPRLFKLAGNDMYKDSFGNRFTMQAREWASLADGYGDVVRFKRKR